MRHSRPDYNRIQDPDKLIPDDEPVFLIRAQDALSGPALRYYADLCRTRATQVRSTHPELTEKLREMAATCDLHADVMDAWPVKKNPDLKPPKRCWKCGEDYCTVHGKDPAEIIAEGIASGKIPVVSHAQPLTSELTEMVDETLERHKREDV